MSQGDQTLHGMPTPLCPAETTIKPGELLLQTDAWQED